jgi:hypothetical protein
MRRKPDIGSLKREGAVRYIHLHYAVDMSNHLAAGKTATGFARSASIFWIEMLRQFPHLFSSENRNRIVKERRAPIVDETWIKWHRNHRAYGNDKLIHHHVEQGPWAVGIPQEVHRQFYPEVHPWTNPAVLGVAF